MLKEQVSGRQLVCMMVLFIMGSNVILGTSSNVGQDGWICFLVASGLVVPLLLLYARISSLFPGYNLYDIIEILFGRFAAKTTIFCMMWYALHLGAMVLRNFAEFFSIISMPETPLVPIMIVIFIVTLYLVKSGIETMARWSVIGLVLFTMVVVVTSTLSLPFMEFSNILPVMERSFREIAVNAFGVVTFPFGETVLFLGLFEAIKKKDSHCKIYLISLLIGGLLLELVFLRNIFLLGMPLIESIYFPSYASSRIIKVGSFLERIDVSISFNYILSGITKISVCLLVAAKGAAKLLGIRQHKNILTPVAMMLLAICAIAYESSMDMFAFLEIYQYYALPFQVFIPVIIWLVAEYKTPKRKKSTK